MLTLISALAFAYASPDEHVSLLQMHKEATNDDAEEFILRKQFKEERFGVPVAVMGTKGTNVCPDGSVKVENEKGCQKLAAALGFDYTVPPKTEFRDVRPGGCYANKKKKAFFNMADGAAFKKATPVCMKPPLLAAPKPKPGKVARPNKPKKDKPKKPRNVCTILKCRKKGWECCFVPLMQRGKKVYGRRGEWAKPNKGNQQNCIKKRGQWCDGQQGIHGPRMPPLPEKKRNVCNQLKCKKKGNECCFVSLMQKGRKVYGRRGEWSARDPGSVRMQQACLKRKNSRWCDKNLNEHKISKKGEEKVVKNKKGGKPGKVARKPRAGKRARR